jgi:ribosome-binding protein aMBF1 (putative translation factor)
MKAALQRRQQSSVCVQLGRALRHMRRRKGISQRKLARACDMSWRDLVRLEGGRLDPDLHLLRRLSVALNGTLMTMTLQLANEQYVNEMGDPRTLRSVAAFRC